MATETHGVTASDVVGQRLPMAEGQVTSSSSGLSTDEIDAWIERAAHKINAVYEARNIDPTALSDRQRGLAQSAIMSYAAARALEKRDFDQERVSRAWSEWQSDRETIKQTTTEHGDAFDADEVVQTNVDTSSDKAQPMFGSDFNM